MKKTSGHRVIYQNYFQDVAALQYGSLEDGALQFERRAPGATRLEENTRNVDARTTQA